jgi:hypothetical protein
MTTRGNLSAAGGPQERETAAGRARVPEPAADAGQFGLPELVIVPAHPVPHRAIEFETREDLGGGAPVLPVFSTVRRLVQVLGPDQPWVAMPLVSIRELAGSAGVREVRLDPSAAPGAWRWDMEELARLEGSLQ